MALFGKNKNNEKDNLSKNVNKDVEKDEAAQAVESEEKQAADDTAATEAAPAATPAANTNTAPAVEIPQRPAYVTPEGLDFNRYFLAERRIMLENVNYETTRPAQMQGQFKLGVKDTIVAQVIGQSGVKATFNRTLRFDPEGPFVLSVSFAVMLVFNPGTRGEIDWRTIDVADEFKKNCPALVQQMSAKAALLVAEITASNTGVPIIPIK